MTPIYASDRIDLSGWYLHDTPPGRLLLWDGGFNRTEDYSRVGLWDLTTGTKVFNDPDWLKQLPQIPMYGFLENDFFTVVDFPHVDVLRQLYSTDHPMCSLEADHSGGPTQFFVSVLNGPVVCAESEVCDFVRCSILPENAEAALAQARERGDTALVRHPLSFWTLKRNPLYASVHRPPCVSARIREVEIDNDGYVGEITCWTTPEATASFFPMYNGDQFPESEVFKPTERINLYIEQGTVLGYDFPKSA